MTTTTGRQVIIDGILIDIDQVAIMRPLCMGATGYYVSMNPGPTNDTGWASSGYSTTIAERPEAAAAVALWLSHGRPIVPQEYGAAFDVLRWAAEAAKVTAAWEALK